MLASPQDQLAKLFLPGVKFGAEGLWIVEKTLTPADYLNAGSTVFFTRDLHAESEAVFQLRPEVTFLRVHGAHHDEGGGVGEGDPSPFDDIYPHGCCVQEDVHDVVVEQVDLVHVKQGSVGLGQNARLDGLDPFLYRFLQVQGSHHPILAGVEGPGGETVG